MDDLISRQAAIDEIEYELEMINLALDSITLDYNTRERLRQRRGEAREILNSIQQLPSAQPDENKYEYHYDHTDCIWYRPEARNRCPATCAQYRDGWNDAMNYIFRDGEGYRPFRRDKKYEG